MRNRRTILTVAVVVVAAAGLFASTRQRLDSHWRDRNIVIDGDNGDWAGPLQPIAEQHPILAAAANDGEFLYLVLSTSDAAVRRQILRQGLILWFDPSGGDKKHFGLHFPVGVPSDEARAGHGSFPRDPGGGGPPSDAGSTSPGDASGQPDPPNRLEVYGPQKDDAHNFVTEMAPGISVKVGQVQGYFVYELKVPLARTAERPYAIEAKTGALIGFGLETPKLETPADGRPGGMGGFGGGGGGMGGRGMGRSGGGGGDRRQFEPPKPIKLWATIQLATR
jgi:hypothetical protein